MSEGGKRRISVSCQPDSVNELKLSKSHESQGSSYALSQDVQIPCWADRLRLREFLKESEIISVSYSDC